MQARRPPARCDTSFSSALHQFEQQIVMYLLHAGLSLIEYRTLRITHVLLKSIDAARQLAGFLLGALKVPRTVARILVGLLERLIREIHRLLDFSRARLNLIEVALRIGIAGRLKRDLSILDREF